LEVSKTDGWRQFVMHLQCCVHWDKKLVFLERLHNIKGIEFRVQEIHGVILYFLLLPLYHFCRAAFSLSDRGLCTNKHGNSMGLHYQRLAERALFFEFFQ